MLTFGDHGGRRPLINFLLIVLEQVSMGGGVAEGSLCSKHNTQAPHIWHDQVNNNIQQSSYLYILQKNKQMDIQRVIFTEKLVLIVYTLTYSTHTHTVRIQVLTRACNWVEG